MNSRFEFFVRDPQRSVDFYITILGFHQIQKGNNPFMVQRDEIQIGFGYVEHLSESHYFRPEITSQRKGLGFEIVLEVDDDDINSFYEDIKKTNYPIAEELKHQEWGLRDFRLVDPDGYYLRITSKG